MDALSNVRKTTSSHDDSTNAPDGLLQMLLPIARVVLMLAAPHIKRLAVSVTTRFVERQIDALIFGSEPPAVKPHHANAARGTEYDTSFAEGMYETLEGTSHKPECRKQADYYKELREKKAAARRERANGRAVPSDQRQYTTIEEKLFGANRPFKGT